MDCAEDSGSSPKTGTTKSDWEQDDEFIADAFQDAIDRAKAKGWTQEDVLDCVWRRCVASQMDHDPIVVTPIDPSTCDHEWDADSKGAYCEKCGVAFE